MAVTGTVSQGLAVAGAAKADCGACSDAASTGTPGCSGSDPKSEDTSVPSDSSAQQASVTAPSQSIAWVGTAQEARFQPWQLGRFDPVLVVGECDFTLSTALAVGYRLGGLVATSLDSATGDYRSDHREWVVQQEWSKRSQNIRYLSSLGVRIAGNVDATRLTQTLPRELQTQFRLVLFTFPMFRSWWDCADDTDDFYVANQCGVYGVCSSVQAVLHPLGELHFVLVKRQLRQWLVLEQARRAGLALRETPRKFDPTMVGGGYSPRDENGNGGWFSSETEVVLVRLVRQDHPDALPLHIPRAEIEAAAEEPASSGPLRGLEKGKGKMKGAEKGSYTAKNGFDSGFYVGKGHTQWGKGPVNQRALFPTSYPPTASQGPRNGQVAGVTYLEDLALPGRPEQEGCPPTRAHGNFRTRRRR